MEKVYRYKPNNFCDVQPWADNIPTIIKVLERFQPKTILEVGGGNYSGSTFGAYLAGNKKAKMITLENNKQWVDYLNSWQKNSQHEIIQIEVGDWKNFKDFDLVFLDHEPETDRIPALDFFRDKAKVVIHHDSRWKDRYQQIWNKYNFVLHDERFEMNTSVCSMELDVIKWF